MKHIKLFSIFLMIFGLLFSGCKNNKNKITLAFCDVAAEYKEAVISTINENFDYELVVFDENLAKIKENPKKISKKYDFIISWNGAVTEALSEYSKDIPASILTNLPETLENNSKKNLPLLLDHYGISYNTKVKQKSKAKYAKDFSTLEKYLKSVKANVAIPFFVEASNDNVLLAFVGSIAESFGGAEAYTNYINALKNFSSMDEFLEEKLSKSLKVKDIFNVISVWKEKGYLPENWLLFSKIDFKNYTREDQIGVAFMSLSEFHSIDNTLAEKFACDRIPVNNLKVNHGLLAPQLVLNSFSGDEKVLAVMEALVQEKGQKSLSKQTKLAPAGLSGMAFDKQSDDVRYLACTSVAGAMPQPSDYFDPASEQKTKAATEIRRYLKTH